MNDVTHVDDGEHVLEGGVGEKQEERAVDVHDAGLVAVLVEVDQSQHDAYHLQRLFTCQTICY